MNEKSKTDDENITPTFWILKLFVLFYFILKFIYLFLAALCLCCCAWAFSSCREWELLFVVVRGLLIAVASLVADHGLQACQLSSCGTRALEHRLSSCGAQALEHRLSSCGARA